MSKQLRSAIEVDASPQQVWRVLVDLAAYPEWNPFIVEAAGQVEPGGRLSLRMQPVGGRAMTLRPTVVAVEEGTTLRWRGRLGVPGLFDAEHSFTLEPLPAGRTRLHQDEHFGGLLVPFTARSLDRGTLPAFEAMNEALKHRAERLGTPSGG